MRHKKNTSEDLYVRPYTITYVYTNGNTTIIRGAVQQGIPLYGLKPITNNQEMQVRL